MPGSNNIRKIRKIRIGKKTRTLKRKISNNFRRNKLPSPPKNIPRNKLPSPPKNLPSSLKSTPPKPKTLVKRKNNRKNTKSKKCNAKPMPKTMECYFFKLNEIIFVINETNKRLMKTTSKGQVLLKLKKILSGDTGNLFFNTHIILMDEMLFRQKEFKLTLANIKTIRVVKQNLITIRDASDSGGKSNKNKLPSPPKNIPLPSPPRGSPKRNNVKNKMRKRVIVPEM